MLPAGMALWQGQFTFQNVKSKRVVSVARLTLSEAPILSGQIVAVRNGFDKEVRRALRRCEARMSPD